ncbi:MAG: hypothetical protein ACFFDT_03710 [Candidatus Hodarchaeota archaeon]
MTKSAVTEPSYVETELYEVSVPGKFIGKAVIDSNARMIGIARSLRIKIPGGKPEIMVKGLDVEFPVNVESIIAVGGVIQLDTAHKNVEEIDINDILQLREEIREEIETIFST